MAEALEREAQPEPAAPTAAAPAALAPVGVGDLAGSSGGHSRPPLSAATVMRLQGSAGNAAVSGLIEPRRGDSQVRTVTLPTAADSAVMRAIVAREPVVMDEQTVPVAPPSGGPVVLEEQTVPVEPDTSGPVVMDEMTVPVAPPSNDGSTVVLPEDTITAKPPADGTVVMPEETITAKPPADGTVVMPEETITAKPPADGTIVMPEETITASPSGASGAAAPTAAPGPSAGTAAGEAAAAAPTAAAGGAAATAGGGAAVPAATPAAGAAAAGAAAPAPSAAPGPSAGAAAGAAPGIVPAAPAPGGAVPGETVPTVAGPDGAAVPGAPGAAPPAPAAAGADAAAPVPAPPMPALPSAAPPAAAAAAASAASVPAASAPLAAGPAGASAGGVAGAVTGGLDAGAAAGEGGAVAEGPSEEELAELEAQLASGPAPEPEPEPVASAPSEPVAAAPAPEPEVAEADVGPEPDEEAGDAPAPEASEPEPVSDAGEIGISREPATAEAAPPSVEMEHQLESIEEPDAPAEEEPADSAVIAADAAGEMEALGSSGGDDMASAGGGGGGGAAVEAQPEPQAPDVSNADPAAAVAAAGSLKPAQMLATLGGAEQAAANHVTKEHEKLTAAPPAVTAGGGAEGPSADEKFVSAAPSRPSTGKAIEKTGGEPEKPAPTPAPAAKAPLPAAPAVQGDEKGNVSQADAAKLQQSIAALPTSDGGVAVPAISAPKLALTGAADPGQMAEQQAHLSQTVAKASAQGAQEAAEPAGEDHLAPTLKPEKVEAEIPAATAGTAGAQTAAADDDTASVVAEEQDGPALRAAAAQAAGQITSEKSQHAANAAQSKAAAAEQAAAEEAKGKADQIAEHAAAKAGVGQARSDWTSEQKTQADAAKTEATGAVGEATAAVQAERSRAEAEAVRHVDAGRKEAESAKRQGDEEARREKEKAKEESSGGGFFGWVASKAKALYDKVKDGITAVFNKVRSAITTAINKAKELAHSVIDRAVKFVADKIKAVASRILAIGDRLIPGFASLRQKFKTWIVNRVKQAVAALNRIVTAVKDGIRRVMSAVGNALKAGLDLLRRGISAAINAVKNVVKAAIEKAKAAIAALGTFAVIIKDIASNPGQWLSNLGAAVMDGIKNHLWVALKTAVQTWFNQKVEQLLGLGKTVWNLLTKGGISMAQVGKMAFDALKAAIPPALIALLVERLVAMIVPAAGAVMAVVQGLMAAWGAIQKIIAAIDRFVAFLKAVKSGNAGPAFAQALAAAAVAVIEFVSQFLLRKIAGAAAKVAGKIKAIAQKIGQRLMKALKKVGKAVKRGVAKVKRGAKRLKEKVFGKKKQKTPEEKKQEKQDRLDKAVTALRPKIAALFAKGTTGLFLKGRLLAWRLMYRLTKLEAKKSGDQVEVIATVNPFAPIGQGKQLDGPRLRELAHLVAEKVLARQQVLDAAARMRGEKLENPDAPTKIDKGDSWGGALELAKTEPLPKTGTVQSYAIGSDGFGVSEQKKRGVANAVVREIGTYPEIAKEISESGLSDVRVATALRSLASTGEMPGVTEDQQGMLKRLAFLMQHRESRRDVGNHIFAPMTLDLIRQGNMSFDEAFTEFEGDSERRGGRGAYPNSMLKATGAERGLAHDEGRPYTDKSLATPADRRELKRREIELVTRWVEVKYKAQLGAIAADETAIAAEIEKMVLGFYGVG